MKKLQIVSLLLLPCLTLLLTACPMPSKIDFHMQDDPKSAVDLSYYPLSTKTDALSFFVVGGIEWDVSFVLGTLGEGFCGQSIYLSYRGKETLLPDSANCIRAKPGYYRIIVREDQNHEILLDQTVAIKPSYNFFSIQSHGLSISPGFTLNAITYLEASPYIRGSKNNHDASYQPLKCINID